ncbi:regulatory protein, luxR family [Sphingobacterium nematocida]|uniref:Regulatory protein, luxR family n=2 Tax=Sphingobacterium nematocida TaxID=1513896 RepID=A0A1T5FMG8_9SPHI|nr:regulatory protein, luxR family [Sphingobacterium nematocida]
MYFCIHFAQAKQFNYYIYTQSLQTKVMFTNSKFIFILAQVFFFSSTLYAQQIDPIQLHEEISTLNDNNQNEKSILILEKIISDPNSTAYDRFHAYLEKSLTYKQLYNYSGALKNLELASQEIKNTDKEEELDIRIIIERILIHFDLKNEKEYLELLKQVKSENLHYVKKETRAFYQCILGHLELRKGNYTAADQHFDACILLLEHDTPKHLPIIYKVKVELYNNMGLKKEALAAFQKGLDYANMYDIDIYKIMMYETIIYYYTSNKEYEKAYLAQKTVSEARRQYDAANRSGKLNLLEKELLQQRNDIEIVNRKNLMGLFSCIILLLCALIFVLFKLYHSNKHRRILMEKEMEQMRIRLEQYISTTSEEVKNDVSKKIINTPLKPRQIEIIDLVRQGKTNKEIGTLLFISENTVKYHLKAIYEILDIDKRSALLQEQSELVSDKN